MIEVRDGNDQVKRQFIYGNGIDELIRMDAYNGSDITPYYFHTNAIGSTTAVTDANGQVVERYKYGLYGMPTFLDAAGNVIPNSAIGNNILFQGREYEPETNFYYFRARHYDPIMGRFLQTDPMGYQDSMNLYQAFNMNPINFVDPWGELIYFTGENLQRDFEEFKKIFVNMGIAKEKLDKVLILKYEKDSGKYYADLIGKKGILKKLSETEEWERDMIRKVIKAWAKNYASNTLYTITNEEVKKSGRYHPILEKNFEEILEWIIRDRDSTPIEFRINSKIFKEGGRLYSKKRTENYGRGVCLSPDDPKNNSDQKNIQIYVDDKPILKGDRKEFTISIYGNAEFRIEGTYKSDEIILDLQSAIVHELGHAYGFLRNIPLTGNRSLNAVLAVMLENLYRIRAMRRSKLRKYH